MQKPNPPARPVNLADDLDLIAESAVAKLRGVEIVSLRNERSRRQGPPWVRFGNTVFYRKAQLRAWLDANTVQPEKKATLTDPASRRRKRPRAA